MKIVQVITKNKKGRCKIRPFNNEQDLVEYLLKVREEGVIKCSNEQIGRIWKEGGRWNWTYDAEKAADMVMLVF